MLHALYHISLKVLSAFRFEIL
ncbi:hypothetical protein VIBNISOn1_190017 [Vibrio nigripulchritudo SOn1]|uniref:Uncharacterized protein n=1 Tax=Vibrio nigripulchritudo SOn1 TaxID=1238450 RepID=A0AAV2VQT7_9VIBR|nr:hypothetical protein VIBNISOn1_190017 [Vibrio nigripulchritudo SOn1]